MGNEPLTFYFLWVSGWETLEEIFSIILVEWFFSPQAESLEDKNMAKVQRCQLEKLKSQCDRLTEELAQNENENKRLKLKYQCLKDELEEKVKTWMDSN